MSTKHQRSHHNFRVATTARRLAVLVKQNPISDTDLRNQAQRAAISVPCNIAESCGYTGAAKNRFLRIAKGSALEVAVSQSGHGEAGSAWPRRARKELSSTTRSPGTWERSYRPRRFWTSSKRSSRS